MDKPTLRDLRKDAHRTASEVAQSLNVSCSAYYSYEQGARRINIEQVLVLATMFDCTEKEVIDAQLNSRHCDR